MVVVGRLDPNRMTTKLPQEQDDWGKMNGLRNAGRLTGRPHPFKQSETRLLPLLLNGPLSVDVGA